MLSMEEINMVLDHKDYLVLLKQSQALAERDIPPFREKLSPHFNAATMSVNLTGVVLNRWQKLAPEGLIYRFEDAHDKKKTIEFTEEQVLDLQEKLSSANMSNPIVSYNKAQFDLAKTLSSFRLKSGGVDQRLIKETKSGTVALESVLPYMESDPE